VADIDKIATENGYVADNVILR